MLVEIDAELTIIVLNHDGAIVESSGNPFVAALQHPGDGLGMGDGLAHLQELHTQTILFLLLFLWIIEVFLEALMSTLDVASESSRTFLSSDAPRNIMGHS